MLDIDCLIVNFRDPLSSDLLEDIADAMGIYQHRLRTLDIIFNPDPALPLEEAVESLWLQISDTTAEPLLLLNPPENPCVAILVAKHLREQSGAEPVTLIYISHQGEENRTPIIVDFIEL